MIAVAGSTGYIGGLLCQRLCEEGQDVRALARHPERAENLKQAGCEVVRADVLEPETLAPALADAEVAYYLVHSMGRGADGDFAARDHEGAENFARAAAVIGAGSESFRTTFYLVRRLPLMITPRWVVTRTQPIAVADAVAYLAAAADLGLPVDREIEIGGPDVTTYGGMIDELAHSLGRHPPRRITVPLLTPWLSSLWIGLVTPVDAGVVRPLIEGLATETIVSDPSGMELFPGVERTSLRPALREAAAGRA